MKRGSGSTTSVWMATAPLPTRQALTKDSTTDVCVVGAGIAGLSAAIESARLHRDVVLVDSLPLIGGRWCIR